MAKRSAELGIETFFPTGLKVVRRRRRHAVEMVPTRMAAMPNYLFVKVEKGQFSQFRRHCDEAGVVPNCLGFLRGRDGPERVKPEVVDDLRKRSAAGQFDTIATQGRYWAPRWLRPGTMLRVVSGLFAGKYGEFLRMTAMRRVSLYVGTGGGMALIECDLGDVARLR